MIARPPFGRPRLVSLEDMGTDARGVLCYAILYCGLLLVLAPLWVSAGASLKADAMCTAGNYECLYGNQPPQGQKGPCMLKKYCFDIPAPKLFVHGECIKLNDCLGTSYVGQDGKVHQMDTDTKKQLDFLRGLQSSSGQTPDSGQPSSQTDNTQTVTSPSDTGTHVDGALNPVSGEPATGGLEPGESILQQVEKYIDPLGGWGEPYSSGPESTASDQSSSPDADNAVSQTPVQPLQAEPDGRIDPQKVYEAALKKVENSELNGKVPEESLRKLGVNGSPESWAKLFTQLQQQESGNRIAEVNADGSLQKFPSTPAGEQSYGPGQFNKGEYGLSTWADVNNPDKVLDAYIKVAEAGKMGAYFGPVQNPQLITQHDGWFAGTVDTTSGSYDPFTPRGDFSKFTFDTALQNQSFPEPETVNYPQSQYAYGPGEASGFNNLAAYNYFSADNTDAWNAIALNENSASFLYGDNPADWRDVAANANFFSDNTGVADESLTDLSNDIANDQAARSFGEEAATVPEPEPTYVFENPYAVSPEEQQAFIEQDSRDIVANDAAARSFGEETATVPEAPPIDWSAVDLAVLDNFAPADQLIAHDQIASDIANDQAARSFGEEAATVPEVPENETPYPAGTIEESALPPPPAVYDLYGESIGNYDADEQGFQNYNYFSGDNADAWNAVALNDNNANFFYGDNEDAFNEVAANENLFSDNNAGPPDESIGTFSEDIGKANADNILNNLKNPFALSADEQQKLVDEMSQNVRTEAANQFLNNFNNPLALSSDEQQKLLEEMSQNLRLESADEFLNNFENPLALSPDEQQKLVDETSRNILADEQRIADYRAKSILNNFYNPLVPTDSQRQELVDDMSQNIFNDQAARSFGEEAATVPEPEPTYVFENPYAVSPEEQQAFIEQDSRDLATRNYFSGDNADEWAKIALNENNANFFYGDNSAEWNTVAANENLLSNNNAGAPDESLTDLSNDIADQQAVNALNAQPDSWPETKTPAPLPTPLPQPKEITPPTPPETKDGPLPPARPPITPQPKVIAPRTPTQPPVPIPLPRPQIRPPAERTPQGETPSAPSGGGGIGGILSSLGQTFGQMLGKLFGGGGSGSAAGQTFAQNTYCITSTDPLIVQNVPAGVPFPSGCYNNPLVDGVPLAQRPQAPVPQSPAPAAIRPAPSSPVQTPTTQNPSAFTPVVTIIANPSTVAVNGTATLAWSSVGTTKCTVSAPNGSQIGASVTDGKATTSPLTTSTTFAILCTTATGATVSGQTTVKVKAP